MAVRSDLRELTRRSPSSPRRRSASSVVGDILLTVPAVLGALCILLVLAALLFDVSIVLFRTGSMGPGIPAGSAALVRDVPAASLEVGDVVTVDRVGRLPITHRIVAIDRAPDDGGVRRLTLRGDANPVADPAPYEVTSAKLLLFSVPGVAPVIAAMGHPMVLGSLTIGAATLVLWAFWPRRGGGARPTARTRPRHGRPREGASAPTAGTAGSAALVLVTGTMLGAAALLATSSPPTPAAAAPEETVVDGTVLRLTSIADRERMLQLAPGDRVVWEVGIAADAPDPGRVTVSLSGTGGGGRGLVGDLRACPVRWERGSCPGSTTIFEHERLPVDGEDRRLLSMSTDEERWLRFEVGLPGRSHPAPAPSPEPLELVVRAVGASDDLAVGSVGPALGRTGASTATPLVMVAVLAGSGGVALVLHRIRRAGAGTRA